MEENTAHLESQKHLLYAIVQDRRVRILQARPKVEDVGHAHPERSAGVSAGGRLEGDHGVPVRWGKRSGNLLFVRVRRVGGYWAAGSCSGTAVFDISVERAVLAGQVARAWSRDLSGVQSGRTNRSHSLEKLS